MKIPKTHQGAAQNALAGHMFETPGSEIEYHVLCNYIPTARPESVTC